MKDCNIYNIECIADDLRMVGDIISSVPFGNLNNEVRENMMNCLIELLYLQSDILLDILKQQQTLPTLSRQVK